MNIKQFKAGQTVYILDLHKGYRHAPEIFETTLQKIGSKYLTTKRGARYQTPQSCGERGLRCEEQNNSTILYASIHQAQEAVERDSLLRWLRKASQTTEDYSLEQLREVKKILDKGEQYDS